MPDPAAAIAFFKDLLRFPSLSREEGPIADYLVAFFGQEGLHPQRLDDNVYVSIGEGDRCLLLNSHLDVVPASEHHPFPPFDAVEHEGAIYGRGSVDAKASGAAMTMALVDLHRNGWQPSNGRVLLALTTCEEIGGDYNGLQQLRPHLPPLSAALIGEPTEMQPCIAQKGLLILHLHAKGESAHAARAHLGKNAIYAAARDLLKLENFAFKKVDPHLGKPTLTTTVIQGGKAKNMIPDVCSFTLDIRSTPAYTHDELIALINDAVEADVEVHSKRLIPVATSPDDPVVMACLKALPNAAPFGSPTLSDWIFIPDVPTVKIGPGPSERSHTPHEHIEIDAFLDGIEAYKRIIQKYFNPD